MLDAGDLAINIKTKEVKLVIAVDRHRKELTFSGDMKWYSAKDWQHTDPPINYRINSK